MAGIVAGIVLFFVMITYNAKIDQIITKVLFTLKAIGIQAKLKILVTFCQVVVTIQPVYGVHMHSAFTSWFQFFEVFNFGLVEIFGIPGSCFGSMKTRLLIGAGWPYVLALVLFSHSPHVTFYCADCYQI